MEQGALTISDWKQTLEEVELHIPISSPDNNKNDSKAIKQQLVVEIQPRTLKVGRKRQKNNGGGVVDYSIDGKTFGTVDVDESTWTLEEDGTMLVIYLQKSNRALVWESVLLPDVDAGIITTSTTTDAAISPIATATQANTTQLTPLQIEEAKQQLMRERWQEENPGFDFRDAAFNGSAPDPREFMGGVKYG